MTPERWRQLEAVFHEAVELQEEERAAFLAKVCAGDRQLREEAEQLIAAHERQSSFIDPQELAETVELRDDHHESLRGRRLGPYEIISQLGRGGMGEVFLAHDSRLGRKVALKMLPAAFTQNADRVSRFEREAKAASALNHPNILTIYEIGRSDGVHFIATEFVDGMTLRQRMNGAKMTVAETLDVALQVATALAAAHEAGIVHRDIKPENVMVRPDGLVKVLDFGLAKLVGSLIPASQLVSVSQTPVANGLHTEFGIMMGTVRYMSPEQASGTARRHAQRYLLVWGSPLRATHRPAPIHRCNGPRHTAKDHPRGSRPSRHGRSIGAARGGGKGTGEGPGQAPPVHALI